MVDIDLAPLKSALKGLQPQGRSALLPALHQAQSIYGYIPEQAAEQVGNLLGIPLADVYGVIDFYTMFYKQPVGKTVIRVCTDLACGLAGGDTVLNAFHQRLDISPQEVSADGAYSVESATCLGLCDQAPAALLGDVAAGPIDPGHISHSLNKDQNSHRPVIAGELRLLTPNCDKGTPPTLAQYEAGGGYDGLRKALQMAPEAVIAEIKASGLVGRGGAAFPTGLKLEAASIADGTPKYMVCNADESEPGTFKDRILMEGDPHRLFEGMIIAAYAIGTFQGYIYIRGEYPRSFAILENAIAEAHQAGFLGKNILASEFNFEIELRQGAGAYICGEETALFESIEGKRGFPRIKPPFPTTHGLFGKPTAVNNVETLCNIPFILDQGSRKYRQYGTEKSPGTKLFCVSGDVKRPGLYEAPFGISLRHLIYDLAGGLNADRKLKAILIGGAAGVFADETNLDLPLTFEHLQAAGLPLGSGVVMVFDETRDLRDTLLRLGKFFAHESCGKCYPCQLGTERQSEILTRLAQGESLPGDIDRLTDVGWTMTDASLCGLGQTAATAVLSTMQLWPELFTSGETGD
jgi:NADH-quinone oxidoreductase subunit F